MKRVISLLVAALLIGMSALQAGGIVESGAEVSKVYPANGFTQITINSAFSYTIRQGDTFTVRIKARESIFSRIEVRQDGTKLTVGLRSLAGFMNHSESPHVDIVLPVLENVSINGASTGSLFFDTRSTEACTVTLSGASKMEASLAAKALKIDMNGASKLTGKILASDFTFYVNGSSDAKCKVELSNLIAQLNGASSFNLTGTAAKAEIKANGASSARSSELSIKKADLQAEGASRIEVAVVNELTARAGGASKIIYTGRPAIQLQDSSGASSILRGD